jgi:myosin I
LNIHGKYLQSKAPDCPSHASHVADLCIKAVTKRAGRASKAPGTATKQTAKPVVRKAVYETSRKKEVGVSDLTLLSKISNESINENLRKRFEHHEIYTYIGHVLISVNPFRDLGIYTDAVLDSYRGKNRLEVFIQAGSVTH